MDIRSNSGYPGNKLSNFAPHPFIFDEVHCGGMEGLLQAFKFPNEAIQVEVCKLSGYAAKKRGSNRNWQERQLLFWKGQEFERKGDEYQKLLDRAYNALYLQSPSFKKALEATGNATLTHTIGRWKKAETVLTQTEFCSRLTKLRDNGLL